jgi:ABC-type bacteriocin/lantibiotic exporter with double-glycine peptidase domain
MTESHHDPFDHLPPTKRLLRLMALERESLSVLVIYGVAVGVLSLAAPLGVQALVSALAFTGLRQPLVILALLVLAGLGFASVLRALQWAAAERIQQRVFVRASFDIARKLAHVRPTGRGGRQTQELVNRFLEVATLQKGAASLLVDGVYIVLQAVVGSIVLAFYHPLLAAYASILVLVVTAVVVSSSRAGATTAIAECQTKYDLMAWFEEMATEATAFRSRHGEAFAVARAKELTEKYLAARGKHFRIVYRQGVTFFALQALSTAGLLGVGGFLVLGGKITLGQLIASELIVSVVTDAFSKFGKYLESYYDVIAAIDKVGYLTDLPLEREEGEALAKVAHESRRLLQTKAISLTRGGREIFRDISLDLGPADRVAILGPNGSGKSAIMDVLWALEHATRGTVEFCGFPMQDLDLRELRNDIALVRGEQLFEGNISENLRLGRTEVGLSEMRAALEAVGLWARVSNLADGMATPCHQAAFSQGEVRRLLLARAIVRPPRLLLLDGILDGIDAESRTALARGVLGPQAPWAVLLATHDPLVADMASKVIVLEGQSSYPPHGIAKGLKQESLS